MKTIQNRIDNGLSWAIDTRRWRNLFTYFACGVFDGLNGGVETLLSPTRAFNRGLCIGLAIRKVMR